MAGYVVALISDKVSNENVLNKIVAAEAVSAHKIFTAYNPKADMMSVSANPWCGAYMAGSVNVKNNDVHVPHSLVLINTKSFPNKTITIFSGIDIHLH